MHNREFINARVNEIHSHVFADSRPQLSISKHSKNTYMSDMWHPAVVSKNAAEAKPCMILFFNL